MTARTPVPVASLSKAMTALAVTTLAEEGRVDLDRPVHDQLPEFAPDDARAARITPRQLLDQTSGMADSTHPDLALPQPRTLKAAVAALHGTRLAADPGTAWHYHNTNYAVAARLVETATGTPYAEHLRRSLFAPLGMTGTETVDSTTDMPDGARGYVRAYGQTIERAHPRLFTAGGFGVVSTADDLGKWLIAQHTEGISATGRRAAPPRRSGSPAPRRPAGRTRWAGTGGRRRGSRCGPSTPAASSPTTPWPPCCPPPAWGSRWSPTPAWSPGTTPRSSSTAWSTSPKAGPRRTAPPSPTPPTRSSASSPCSPWGWPYAASCAREGGPAAPGAASCARLFASPRTSSPACSSSDSRTSSAC
ncbi:serine hydrolase domain-containing protein [Actinomadura keratinilytica]